MQTRRYSIDTFLAPHESFHYAQKTLTDAVPGHVHDHDFFEVLMVSEGKVVHWINGSSQILDAGAVLFVRPQDAHALAAVDGSQARVVNVLFRAETARHLAERYEAELAGRFFWSAAPLPATLQLNNARQGAVKALTAEMQSGNRSLSRIEKYLLSLLMHLSDLPDASGAGLPDWLLLACEMAREPEVFRLGAAGFVQAAGRGHEHVCRKTKEHMGVTPSAYINRIRMEHAARLLASQDISVGDVADACGIENMSHFYRVFRQHYGVTPKAFRKQHQLSPF